MLFHTIPATTVGSVCDARRETWRASLLLGGGGGCVGMRYQHDSPSTSMPSPFSAALGAQENEPFHAAAIIMWGVRYCNQSAWGLGFLGLIFA